ncbi:MAG TPA: hypothetical protein VFV38_02315 [Ktedonobacteraceae bacterium]|nr:hypothetical protein [Ktedonobacteraceae bacterium]
MAKRNSELVIYADTHLALHAGWWEERTESDGTGFRMISPAEQTLFDQVLLYLKTIVAQSPKPSTTQSTVSEQVRAILSACLRCGSSFAVLADEAKSLWSRKVHLTIMMTLDFTDAIKIYENSEGGVLIRQVSITLPQQAAPQLS